MSGIFGVYYFDGQSAKPEVLQQMSGTLAHRGSDGADIWYQDNVGLGHRLLWTTPESLLETLPLAKDNLVLTADARIDNRDELISTLKIDYLPPEKITDSDLILAAYQKWGDQCPVKLIGDFAFAIWDQREQIIFCARDPMGVKPFFYYHSNNLFVFASEIKALFPLPEVPRQLNELMVAYHLEAFYEDREITFYQNILRLPGASSLIVNSSNQIKIQSYWSLDPQKEIKLKSRQDYIEAFQEVFTESVKCRLRSAFPIGSTLSGGLDSSSIACTARQILLGKGQQLHTFSAIFPSLSPADLRLIDERPYMDAVKSLEGLQSHDLRADLLTPLTDILWNDEEPIFATNLYIHQGIYDLANQQGVRVVLDGLDGDVTVGHGWSYLSELLYSGKWYKLILEVNSASQRYRISRKRIVRELALNPIIEAVGNYIDSFFNRVQENDNQLIDPGFAQSIGINNKITELLKNKPKLVLTTRQKQHFGLTSGLYSHVLNMADKATTQSSVEARYPFFDRRLMEFCLALPPEQKLNQGWSRAILRYAMTDILPPSVQWRLNKSNLFPNFRSQLLNTQSITQEQMTNNLQNIEKYVEKSTFKSSYNNYVSHPEENGQDAINLLGMLVLSHWLKESFPS
ncbi:MAG: lasso peptide isopeptide bond-forming cyclase [Waterburya sp.]